MEAAAHCADAATSKAVRAVLHVLHQNKRQQGVDEMLNRLYQPILWRAVKAANSVGQQRFCPSSPSHVGHRVLLVRRNAAAILVDAFPLQNPDSSRQETDALCVTAFPVA